MSIRSASSAIVGYSVFGWFAVLFFVFSLCPLAAQPDVYFASADGLSGDGLKAELHDIIDGHQSLSYTPGVWNAHKDLYEDPDNPNNLILFYSEISFSKSAQDSGSGSVEYWNREHLWPRSYGVSESSSANTDLFHLVPANKAVNNRRGNLYFDKSSTADGGISSPGHSFAPETSRDSNSWEPGDRQKGWVARAMFYMTTRYEQLDLVDTPPEPEPSTSATRMAQRAVLLRWNREFRPTDREKNFNDRVQADYQGNRNPFIDYPEFADAIWVGYPSWGDWRLRHFSLAELQDPEISGPDADPDHDLIPNLFELSRYSDPMEPDLLPAYQLFHSETSLEIVFDRMSDLEVLNLTLQLETSIDGSTWTEVDLSDATVEELFGGLERVRYQISLEPSALESRLYRLSAVEGIE